MTTTTEQKIELVKNLVIELYVEGLDKNQVCTNLIAGNMHLITEGHLQFTEVEPIVKNIGISEGFIVPLTQRKENCNLYIIENKSRGFHDYEDFQGYIDELASKFDVTNKWAEAELRGIFVAYEMSHLIPEKDHLIDWQRALVECYTANPSIGTVPMIDYIENNSDTGSAKQYVNRILPILREIDKLRG